MLKVIKNEGKMVNAYCLGKANKTVENLIAEGKVIPLEDGGFEVMSQEAVAGGSGHGQLASAGDYIKIDSTGCPYPVRAAWFEKNHKCLGEDLYEQIPVPRDAWTVQEPMCPEVEFLIRERGLVLNEQEEERYFTAPISNTIESAPKDAILMFYSIIYAEDGSVTDAEYNFVVREEFEKDYHIYQ